MSSRTMPNASSEKPMPVMRKRQNSTPGKTPRQMIQHRRAMSAPTPAQSQTGTRVTMTMASHRFSRQIATAR